MEVEIEQNLNKNACSTNFHELTEFPTVDTSLTYNQFFKNCILKNVPCKIENISTSWECSKYWTEENKPNFNYLESKYGQCRAVIYNCKQKYFNSQKCENTVFSEFLKYWQGYVDSNYDNDKPLLYLKDWHLKNRFPEDNFYEVPLYFASDWLNEYLCANNKDDYRFVYMGPKGTWTPFHADVFTSFSWSVNICGRKKWIFIPPGEENKLKDKFGNLLYDITSLLHSVKYFEVIQKAGEAVFVPSNWHHQVWNLEDTISVNHNWVNGCNIGTMWLSLSSHLVSVKNEIEDCKDMPDFEEHCQLMLKASFGMDFEDFYKFIAYIAEKRIKFLRDEQDVILPEKRKLGRNHTVFDLLCIGDVIKLMLNHEDVKRLNCFKNMLYLNDEIKSIVS